MLTLENGQLCYPDETKDKLLSNDEKLALIEACIKRLRFCGNRKPFRMHNTRDTGRTDFGLSILEELKIQGHVQSALSVKESRDNIVTLLGNAYLMARQWSMTDEQIETYSAGPNGLTEKELQQIRQSLLKSLPTLMAYSRELANEIIEHYQVTGEEMMHIENCSTQKLPS